MDAKSPSTYTHSVNVAKIAVELGESMGLGEEELVTLRRAGLLHDVGKLSVPNSILDKPGRLTAEGSGSTSRNILSTRTKFWRAFPPSRSSRRSPVPHHEKLDGSGYHRGIRGEELCRSMRILTVADMYEALSAKRPYREALSHDEVMRILCRDTPHAVDEECLAALEAGVRSMAPVEGLPFPLGRNGQSRCGRGSRSDRVAVTTSGR